MEPTNQSDPTPESESTPNQPEPTTEPEPITTTDTSEPTSEPESIPEPSQPDTTPPPAPESSPTASVPESPAEEAAVVHSTGGGVVSTPLASAKAKSSFGKPRRRRLFIIGAVVLVLLLGGGFVFGIYLPSQPLFVYKTGMKNTAKAADAITDYVTSPQLEQKQGFTYDANLNVKSSGVSVDASITGKADKNANSDTKVNIDVMGQKITANVRGIKPAASATPDVYVQITGVKDLLSQEGLGTLSGLDGQWILVDHTLIDSLESKITAAQPSSTATATPTYAQFSDAVKKVNEVNKQYLFTTDTSKTVVKDGKFVGKETVNGRSAYHYNTGYDKAHLEAYVKAVGSALDSSQLNAVSKKSSGKNLSETLQLAQTEQAISKANASYRFDVWIDAKTKLLSQLKFVDPKDSTSILTLYQTYSGGSVYPFGLTFDDGKTDSSKGSLRFSMDTQNTKFTLDLDGSDKSSGTTITLHAAFAASDAQVKPAVPAGAVPLNAILGQLGGQGLLGASTNKSNSSTKEATPLPTESIKTFFQ